MIVYCPLCGAELLTEVKGQWIETGAPCRDCGLTVADPPLMLAPGPDEDEVEYVLDEWPVGDRGAITAALVEVDIPYRWEAGLALVVPVVAEEEVDRLLDELDEGDDDGAPAEAGDVAEDEDGDGGEAAQAAMADLFVAADRLQHAPTDEASATKLDDAAAVVVSSLPPYGIERPVWRKIQGLAAAVVAGMDEGADEELVVADARALRDFLRDLV